MDSQNQQQQQPAEYFHIIVIGAGLSGINTGYRIQSELPECNYTILEGRHTMGGTWDLFRYPGVRSDSDLHTFGFSWRPWLGEKTIAGGELIRTYLRECAEAEGIDKKIRYRHKVISANWSSTEQLWNLDVDTESQTVKYQARFVIFCTGYYNYKEPLASDIPGLENFKGTLIRPQFWPEDMDYTGKKIVIIGSGATAVTLVPNLAKKASHVTMLQRSPTYILASPANDRVYALLRRLLPVRLAARITRIKFLVLPFCFFQFCRFFPGVAKSLMRAVSKAQLPSNVSVDPHFSPRYNPWEQRLCLSPDGDIYSALGNGTASVVTDTIKTVTATGIQTTGGKSLDADIIVLATGLKLQLAGGASINVDEKPVDIPSKYLWRGAMMQDIPNAAFIIGYTNAAWTLGADSTTLLLCRLFKQFNLKETTVVPRMSTDEAAQMKNFPILNLSSTYIQKANGILPKSGNKAPWLAKQNYFMDSWVGQWSDLRKGLQVFKSTKAN
ncbi:unnamed protein product [Blumeria hordei]|uniref:Monooxygenase n=2 Tax=Blumeria hordei TaxID=2867405 RepID=A0A383UIQ8_BLUHO|nr:monooxygenase [Blumeria hordei DH14]SZE99584.1 unnamed protein product [Blumeria hordei]